MSYRSSGSANDRAAPHTKLKRSIREYLLWHGAYIIDQMGGLGQRRGLADLTICLRGRFVCIEVKTGEAVLSTDQVKERGKAMEAGALFIEARSVDQVEDVLFDVGLIATRNLMR